MTIRGMIQLAKSFSRRQLHVISRSQTNIKPASPTPLNLKRYNFPIQDQMMAHIYVPMILYYPNSEQNSPTTISNQLKNSLSQTLSKYYPFAGRLRSGSYVDCNDKGVPFVEAQIGCQLSNVLERAPDKSQDGILTHLFPPYTTWDSVPDQAPNLMVQLNHFACGGIAVTASLSHRLADASSLCSFLRYWATLSRHSGDFNKLSDLHPHFRLHQPPVEESHVTDDDDFNDSVDDDNDSSTKAVNSFHAKPYMCKEIVFHNTSIAKLRDTNKLQGVVTGQRYTRNELVTALIYRCAVAAAATSNSGIYGTSVLCQAVNVRPLIDPPLPETIVGNFLSLNDIPTSTESETQLNLLVDRMRKGKMQLKGRKSLDEYELLVPKLATYAENKQRFYLITSMCNFPIYDGMDFGWGKPIKGTMPPFVDCIILMDTPSGDGIKAIVGLEEHDMKNFQANEELLAYASF